MYIVHKPSGQVFPVLVMEQSRTYLGLPDEKQNDYLIGGPNRTMDMMFTAMSKSTYGISEERVTYIHPQWDHHNSDFASLDESPPTRYNYFKWVRMPKYEDHYLLINEITNEAGLALLEEG